MKMLEWCRSHIFSTFASSTAKFWRPPTACSITSSMLKLNRSGQMRYPRQIALVVLNELNSSLYTFTWPKLYKYDALKRFTKFSGVSFRRNHWMALFRLLSTKRFRVEKIKDFGRPCILRFNLLPKNKNPVDVTSTREKFGLLFAEFTHKNLR